MSREFAKNQFGLVVQHFIDLHASGNDSNCPENAQSSQLFTRRNGPIPDRKTPRHNFFGGATYHHPVGKLEFKCSDSGAALSARQ
jgi:hypothetical protein